MRVGLSGWNYAHWRGGVFYPPRLPASRWLEFYAERFDTVEVNAAPRARDRAGNRRPYRGERVPDA